MHLYNPFVVNVSAGANSINASAFTFSNSNGVSFGLNGSTITGSVANQTNQSMGFYAVGNTTQNSSTTLDARTLSFDGLGIVTAGFSNGSIQISATQSAQSIGFYAVGNTTQNSSTTLDARTLSFDGLGAASVGYSNGSIQVSVPTRKVSQLLWPDDPWQTHFAISDASFSLQHFNPKADIIASQMNLLAVMSGNSGSSGALTISFGIYTMAGSTMSLASSDSRQISWTSGSNTTASSIYGGVSGTRYRTISLANWSISAGDYMIGAWFKTTNDGSWRFFGREGPTIIDALDVNETNHFHHGYYINSYTSAMIASINVTNTSYVRTGGDALKQPSIILLGSY